MDQLDTNQDNGGDKMTKIETFTCGDTVHVFVASDADALETLTKKEGEKLASKRGGPAVKWKDGSRDFTTREIVFDVEKKETFHADGDRIKCQIVRVHVGSDGTITRTAGKIVWVGYDRAWAE